MTTRICVYKDCNNLYLSQVNNDVTLFSFPKDPMRAELWRKLGQVHPKIGVNQMFMCSKHFDSKFLAVAKKRTILVGEAVPNPYKEKENDTDAPTTLPSTEQTALVYNNHKDLTPASSSAHQSFYIEIDDENSSIDMVESTAANVNNATVCIGNSEIEVSIVSPSRKRAHLQSSPITLNMKLDEPAADNDAQLIDTSEVSIFKFKGENYVQMSQEYYLQEKRQMLDELRRYKRIMGNLKIQLSTLEDI